MTARVVTRVAARAPNRTEIFSKIRSASPQVARTDARTEARTDARAGSSIDTAGNRAARKWTGRQQTGRVLFALARPLFAWSPRPAWGFRRAVLRAFGAAVGAGAHVAPGVRIRMPWNLSIGDRAAVGDGAILYALGKIGIGDDATVSQGAHLCAGTHDFRVPAMTLLTPPIAIGAGAWVCADAFVGPGVAVGAMAVVGARAVVVRDVPPGAIVAGNPARRIGTRELLPRTEGPERPMQRPDIPPSGMKQAGAALVSRRPAAKTATIPVTVVIPVRNEEDHLPACLARLSRFAEIVVVDSGSTDRTVAIAEASGARVVRFAWNGRYPKKRNHVLLNEPLSAPWVLFLDADEMLTDAFVAALEVAIASPGPVGYWLNYTSHFLGRELRHGVPQRKLALFRVGAGLYERVEEDGWSALDMEVHEHPLLDGPVGEIAARIDHRDFRGLDRFIARHLDYARWEVFRREALLAAGPAAAARLTPRQRRKYRHLAAWWFAWAYFLAAYIGRGGFRDGGAGLAYAFYKAWYFATIRHLILERRAAGRMGTMEGHRTAPDAFRPGPAGIPVPAPG